LQIIANTFSALGIPTRVCLTNLV